MYCIGCEQVGAWEPKLLLRIPAGITTACAACIDCNYSTGTQNHGLCQSHAETQDLVTAAKDPGETLTLEAALTLVNCLGTATSKLLLDVECNPASLVEGVKG